jgi:Domain of unknown function (DUF3291)
MFHIAQINIGRIKAPLDDRVMTGFVTRLDEFNALADRSPGFVWRLQTVEGNATYFRPFEDERVLLNMSVWKTIETLREYVYRTGHSEMLRQREQWFERLAGTYLALWWVPVGHIPSIEEAKQKLAYLDTYGPTQFAFTFKTQLAVDEEFQKRIDWSAFRASATV